MKTGEQPTKYSENELLDELAARNGLAIVLADGHSSALHKSNNNSMCEMLYNSKKFAPECGKFCGKAFERTVAAGEPIAYKCYAGLNCMAVQIERKDEPTVAIVGRTFTESDDYRQATRRAVEGDWREFPANEFFENVLLGNSKDDIENLARKIEQKSNAGQKNSPPENQSASAENQNAENVNSTENQSLENDHLNDTPHSALRTPQFLHWRSLFGTLLDLSYRQSCLLIVQFVADRYAVENVAWLEKKNNRLETIYAKGKLKDRAIEFSIGADDARLRAAARAETALELRERRTEKTVGEPQTIRLFPIMIADEIKSALVIGDEIGEREKKIARFCQKIAADLEILRLREELSKSGLLERAVRRFNETLTDIDSEDFWTNLNNVSAEILKAERSSLLVFDEKADVFIAKAATGIKADSIKAETENLGARVSRNAFNGGAAIVVEDIEQINLEPAPSDWLYKSDSFISYPITIGTRKIGVLNLTDRADGDVYSDLDLEILNSIVPQLAVLIDRANLKSKAGEFEHLSVTDALTGLLNRRYLEERLTEEIKRSHRHGFPMSFMMIDVDEFKSYNDNFGHTEGDKALQIVGACLKETLRGADVAARYGGEEFSILLPQTNTEEASVIAERVRERVEQRCFPNRQVTISVGIASSSLDLNSVGDLISAADKALYEAKRNGRNNVQIYENLK